MNILYKKISHKTSMMTTSFKCFTTKNFNLNNVLII
jgi:hypothetical protein